MKTHAYKTLMLLLLFSLTSCGSAAAIPGALQHNRPLVPSNPNATSTPTPFIPLPPTETPPPVATSTPTPLPTATPMYPWGNFDAPVEPSAIEIPPPMPQLDFPEGVVNIVLLGSDERPYEGGHRTDTMMIVSLNPEAGTATILSIPRDLYVYIPGWRVDRINTADVRGGIDWVAATILYNFGIEIDHWVEINFQGFIAIIDTLGGIYVPVEGYVNDECGGNFYSFGPGTHYMDGFTSLCYVRMRKRSSDFDRLRRQQEVMQAIFNRVLSLDGLARVPELYNQFQYYVQTDMTLDDILPLIPLGAKLASDPSQIHRAAIDRNLVTSWRVPYSGASVLLPNRTEIQAMLLEVFLP